MDYAVRFGLRALVLPSGTTVQCPGGSPWNAFTYATPKATSHPNKKNQPIPIKNA